MMNTTIALLTEGFDVTTMADEGSKCMYGPGQRAPNSSEVIQQLKDMGAGAYVWMMVPVLLFTIMAIIYVEEAVFLMQHTEYWKRTQQKLWILSSFPVISGLCVVGLFFPRSSPTIQIMISFYNALVMKQYFDLILHYYGGKKKMAEITNEIAVPAYAFPCIIWCCFPKVVMNVRNIRIMQYLIYPVTVYQPIAFFIMTVLWNEELQGTSLAPLVMAINLSVPLASFVAVYGFVIMNKASERCLIEFRIRGKFITTQLILGINTIQSIVLLLMDRFQAMPCGFPYHSPRPGFILHLYIFPMELFLLALAARYFFRFSERGLQPIAEPRDSFDEIKIGDSLGKDARHHENDADSDYRSSSDRHSSVNSGSESITRKLHTSQVASDGSASVRLKTYKDSSDERFTPYDHITTI